MISIVHPSYMRPKQAKICFQAWVGLMEIKDEIEWILSLSEGDPYIDEYRELMGDDGEGATIIVAPTQFMVQASNVGAEQATGDIIILVSDDMFPPNGWDKMVLEAVPLYQAAVLQVHDSIRDDIITLPIMNRAAYERLGYLYHPLYLSMWADNDLRKTAEANSMLVYRPDLVFEHRHYTVGKSAQDMTYKHENSKTAFDHGKRLFDYRTRQGFPIR